MDTEGPASGGGWWRYAVAVGAALLTLAVTVGVQTFVYALPAPPFLAAVILVAWFAGFGPAMVTSALAAVALAYVFVPPQESLMLGADDLVATALFLAVAVTLAWLADRARRSRDERSACLAREATARAAAQDASRAKDELLAMVAHDVRTPLAAIRASLHGLERSVACDDAGRRLRAIIGHQIEQIARMLEDLTDASRVIADGAVLDRRVLDLAALVRQSTTTVTSAGAERRHVITVDAEPVWVEGDPSRLERIFVNLLDNAVKYTPEGGTILIQVRPDGVDAVARVQDTGPGIAPDLLPKIFEPFVQGESPGRRGLGIGLAVARRLVEAHGGRIEAASAGPERGSCFTVRLPRVPRPAGPLDTTARSTAPVQPA